MTKLIDRRTVLRGAAKASAALGIGLAPVAAELAIAEATEGPHPDTQLERYGAIG